MGGWLVTYINNIRISKEKICAYQEYHNLKYIQNGLGVSRIEMLGLVWFCSMLFSMILILVFVCPFSTNELLIIYIIFFPLLNTLIISMLF